MRTIQRKNDAMVIPSQITRASCSFIIIDLDSLVLLNRLIHQDA